MISSKPGTCNRCGKKLTKRECGLCKGHGTVSESMTQVAKLCEWCGGSGVMYACNPCLEEILPKAPPITPSAKEPEQELRKTITCPTCHGFKYLVHPNTGVGGLCTQCRGKGWIFMPKFN